MAADQTVQIKWVFMIIPLHNFVYVVVYNFIFVNIFIM